MSNKHVILRGCQDYDSIEIAIIKTTSEHTREELFELTKKVISDWINSSEDGRDAWLHSVEDFNVGDLAQETLGKGSELNKYFEKHGVYGFEIEQLSTENSLPLWHFDSILANKGDIVPNCNDCETILNKPDSVVRVYMPKDEDDEAVYSTGHYLNDGTFEPTPVIPLSGNYDTGEDRCAHCNAIVG